MSMNKVCRLCVEECSEHVELNNLYLGEELAVTYIYAKLQVDICVREGTGSPVFLCKDCHELMAAFQRFELLVKQAQHKYRQLQLKYIEENLHIATFLPTLALPLEGVQTHNVKVASHTPPCTEVIVDYCDTHDFNEDLSQEQSEPEIHDEDSSSQDVIVTKCIDPAKAEEIKAILDTVIRHGKATDLILNSYKVEDIIKNKKFTSTFTKVEELFDLYCDMKCHLCADEKQPVFNSYKELDVHSRIEHNTPCKVKCCDHHLRDHTLMKIHIVKKHLAPVPTLKEQCTICKKMIHRRNIRHHIRNHVPAEKKKYKCDLCPAAFIMNSLLTNHVKNVHSTSEQTECDECGKMFVNKSILNNHKKITHHSNLFLCFECGKRYKSKTNYIRHMRLHKGEDERVRCPQCDKVVSVISLRNHMRRHNPEKLKQCPHCPKKMFSGMSSHIKSVHDGDGKKHNCNFCSKKFRTKSALDDHVASRHTGIPNHMCEFCDKTFNCKTNYFTHRKRMHSAQVAQKKLEAMEDKDGSIPVYDPVSFKKRKRAQTAEVQLALEELSAKKSHVKNTWVPM